MGLIADMIPQRYPLACVTDKHEAYLVLGWMTDDKPIVVRQTYTGQSNPTQDTPHVLDIPVAFRTPYLDVTIDGEVDANVSQ